MDFNVAHLLIWYGVFVFSTTCHEFAHAFAAYRGGDPTAYAGGVMSLDPMPHIQRSPFGMLVVPIISYITGGWMIGWASVPFDSAWGRRNPLKQGLMSLAGPATNFLLSGVALISLKLLLAAGVFVLPLPGELEFTKMVALPPGVESTSARGAVAMALSILMNLNAMLGVFNLMPVPPLDGAGVVQGFWPKSLGRLIDWFYEVPMAGMLGLFVAWNLFGYIAGPVLRIVLGLLL